MALVLLTLVYYRGGKLVSKTDFLRNFSVLGYLRVYDGIMTSFYLFLGNVFYLCQKKNERFPEFNSTNLLDNSK